MRVGVRDAVPNLQTSVAHDAPGAGRTRMGESGLFAQA
jgi:hypothetical protein